MKKLLFTILCLVPTVLCAEELETASVWRVSKACQLVHSGENIVLETDGRTATQRLYFKMKFPFSLQRPPKLMLSEDVYQVIEVDGFGKAFGFSIDYHPQAIAKLLSETNALIVEYTPQAYYKEDGVKVSAEEVFNYAIPTQSLPQRIVTKAEECLPR